MHRLEAKRIGLFSSDYRISEADREVTFLDLAALRSRGEFQLDGSTYAFQASGLLSGSYTLEAEGRTVARAAREGLLPLTYRVHAGDRMLLLRSHAPGRRFSVLHGDRVIGTIRASRFLSRNALVEFNEPTPLAVEYS